MAAATEEVEQGGGRVDRHRRRCHRRSKAEEEEQEEQEEERDRRHRFRRRFRRRRLRVPAPLLRPRRRRALSPRSGSATTSSRRTEACEAQEREQARCLEEEAAARAPLRPRRPERQRQHERLFWLQEPSGEGPQKITIQTRPSTSVLFLRGGENNGRRKGGLGNVSLFL